MTITEPKELNDRERVLSWAKEHDRKRKAELDRTAPNPEEVPSGGEFSKRSDGGNKRNDKRLRIADESDADILGEFPCLTESLPGREERRGNSDTEGRIEPSRWIQRNG